MKTEISILWLALSLLSGNAAGSPISRTSPKGTPPMIFRDLTGTAGSLVRMPDGTLKIFSFDKEGRMVSVSYREDRGAWTAPNVEFEAKEVPQRIGTPMLASRSGELHIPYLVRRGTGKVLGVDECHDVWYTRTDQNSRVWRAPTAIFRGFVGALMDLKQLSDGRVVLPLAYAVPGREDRGYYPTGIFVSTVFYSDDDGQSWSHEAELTAPCFPNYNGYHDGACEPVVLELKDHQVWMLIRTQTGFLYESSSADGRQWSHAEPSRFYSSSAPAALLRLNDGRIAVFWNNCELPPRVEGEEEYGGREALHAAISDDEGATWRGFREVYLDPARHDRPVIKGDRGTAYPSAECARDGSIILISGQGSGRRNVILIHPDWLTETHAEDDFSNGFEQWTAFKSFGPPLGRGPMQDRTLGPEIINLSSGPAGNALHIRRADEKVGDGAVWNFPIGRKGRVRLQIMFKKGFGLSSIGLNDRFFNPTDDNGEKYAIFRLVINPGGLAGPGASLQPGHWYSMDLEWDLSRKTCDVLLDGRRLLTLPLLNNTNNGVCYLRLRSLAASVDPAGFLVRSVTADIDQAVTPALTVEQNRAEEVRYRSKLSYFK